MTPNSPLQRMRRKGRAWGQVFPFSYTRLDLTYGKTASASLATVRVSRHGGSNARTKSSWDQMHLSMPCGARWLRTEICGRCRRLG
jgi:hypothetical protein